VRDVTGCEVLWGVKVGAKREWYPDMLEELDGREGEIVASGETGHGACGKVLMGAGWVVCGSDNHGSGESAAL
jgi:hypothetical protein